MIYRDERVHSGECIERVISGQWWKDEENHRTIGSTEVSEREYHIGERRSSGWSINNQIWRSIDQIEYE